MEKIFYLILAIAILSCKNENQKKFEKKIVETDNTELIEIYQNDQSDRMTDNINWLEVNKRDSLRRVRVHQLLDSGKVITGLDFKNAAMVFQHGKDSTDYGLAVKLMKKAIEKDTTINKWLFAAATDRYLLSKGEPQIYGTQYQKMGDEPWKRGEIDTTKISDAERIEYGVETLAQQREKVKQMNKKKLSRLVAQGKSIDDIIKFIKSKDKNKTEFDISESGINSFGYNLLGEGKNKDALKIFKVNTELYPNEFNTWDSYGECLLILGKNEEGIKAYQNSLELNPKNENAKKVIAENK